jgi:DNA primase
MTMIPDDKVAEVRERASILEVIGDYVALKRSGANYQGLCPFHGEKTPSFNVNPGRGIFHCFGCGVGGNVFTFVMKIEGLAFPEAVKFLAKRTGVVIEDRPLTSVEKRRQDEREQLYRINDLAAGYYRRTLLEGGAGEPCRRYLERRGVDAATSEAYRLGFSSEKWDGLVRHLEQKRIPLEEAEKLGLVRKKQRGGYHDLFRNRLIFPIADPQGRTVGFGARVLDDALPKYINSPESPIYRKGDILFGVNLARQAMRESGAAIIVEGYFDHLALYQAGVRHAVATCGTALTDGHMKLLQRYAGKVYTLFDSDNAGIKATLRTMDLFLEGNLPAFVVELPAGDDPDSFIGREGSAAFGDRLAGARSIFDFFLRAQLSQADIQTVAGKVEAVEAIAPRLMKIGNQIERDLYVRETARMIGVDERLLQRKIGRAPVTAADLTAPPQQQKQRTNRTEEMLLALMGKYPEVARQTREYGAEKLFSPEFLPVAEAILAQLDSAGVVDLALILEQLPADEERSRLAGLFVDDGHLEEMDPRKAFEQCRKSCELRQLKRLDDKELKRELARLDSDSPRYWEILRLLDDLRSKKSQLHR